MEITMPTCWIMKITPGESQKTAYYFSKLFVEEGSKNVIGYTKDDNTETYAKRWNEISIGDLIIVLEARNKVHGVVEVTSDPYDDDNEVGEDDSDWFYHRRNVKIIKHFTPYYVANHDTNIDTIIKYSGDGAVGIMDEVWDMIKEDYFKIKTKQKMEKYFNLLKLKPQIILQGSPGTGKTKLAKELAYSLTMKETSEVQEQIENFFKTFEVTESVLKTREQIKELNSSFQKRFPKEKLQELTLANYCIGSGSNDSFCWWLERGLRLLGSYSPGTSRSYLIYWKKSENRYSTHYNHVVELKHLSSPEEAMSQLAKMLSELVNDENLVAVYDKIGSGLILKIMNSYYPEKYFPVNSLEGLKNILSLLKIDYSGLNTLEMSLRLQAYFENKKLEYQKDITNHEFMFFIYSIFDPKKVEVLNEQKTVRQGDYKLIQFHPSYSYEDFVRGIMVETQGNLPVYKVANRILADFASKAMDDPKSNYILVIDEINRANLSSVLGELIYALEYRFDPEKKDETTVESMYAIKVEDDDEEKESRELALPPNLYIIGTMNTADRSAGHIDYAIRRRFAFVDVLPTSEPLAENGLKLFKLVSGLFISNFDQISDWSNPKLQPADSLSKDFRPEDVWLGHSYFITKSDHPELSEEEQLKLKVRYEVLPILKEYLKDGILIQNETLKTVFSSLDAFS